MNIKVYSAKLRNLKLIPTIQRIAVLEFLEKNRIHPTAEDIYYGVKDCAPSLTKATVYNVLDALKKVDAIQELTIDRKMARYDCNAEPHLHFLCQSCGNLYDIDLSCSIRPGDVVLGHQVEVVQIYLYGVCVQCNNGNPKSVEGSAKVQFSPTPESEHSCSYFSIAALLAPRHDLGSHPRCECLLQIFNTIKQRILSNKSRFMPSVAARIQRNTKYNNTSNRNIIRRDNA